jgi:hypothetical protein
MMMSMVSSTKRIIKNWYDLLNTPTNLYEAKHKIFKPTNTAKLVSDILYTLSQQKFHCNYEDEYRVRSEQEYEALVWLLNTPTTFMKQNPEYSSHQKPLCLGLTFFQNVHSEIHTVIMKMSLEGSKTAQKTKLAQLISGLRRINTPEYVITTNLHGLHCWTSNQATEKVLPPSAGSVLSWDVLLVSAFHEQFHGILGLKWEKSVSDFEDRMFRNNWQTTQVYIDVEVP